MKIHAHQVQVIARGSFFRALRGAFLSRKARTAVALRAKLARDVEEMSTRLKATRGARR